jgi:sulfatase modifying factor 1
MRALPFLLSFFAALGAAIAQTGRDVGVFRRDAAPSTGRGLAIVVGCDQYESLATLQFAERDADDVGKELEAIGFRVVRMRVGGPTDEPKPLTGGAILTQVEKLCRVAEPDGALLFYFSGHGFEAADGRVYLCPFGADPAKLQSTGLDLEEVQKRFVGSGCKQRLLVVDMCRKAKDKSIADRELTLQRFQQAQGTGFLFSTAPGTLSFEPEAGMKDEAGVVMQNGLFTHYLLRGLRGEADRGRRAQKDGFVTFREVAYFVSDGLADLSLKYRALEQVPYLRWDGTAEDVLLRVLAEPLAVSPSAPEVQPAAQPQPVVPSKPEGAAGRDVSSWAKVLRVDPDPSVVTDAEARSQIVATGWPWRVEDKASGIVMLLVPPGEFMMGSPANEADRGSEEEQHRRRITQAFYLGETEVTQASWQRVMGNNPSHFQGSSNPVEQVSWNDIQPFLQKTGLALPSEAQWEYACRAGTTTAFSFGATLSTSQANYDGNYTYGPGRKGEYRERTTPVGTLGKNAWGLADMHGNVWEWCADGYQSDYPGDGATEAPAAGASRVLRGGSWRNGPAFCRAALRSRNGPAGRYVRLGFRAARTL